MRKILLVCASLLCLIIALTPLALADGDGYVERPTEVITNGEVAGELVLRFYDATPNVPYLGMAAYSQYVRQLPLTLQDNGDGTCALVNGIGETLICDAAAGQITVPDWTRFFDYPVPIEGGAMGWSDMDMPFVRIVDVTYEGEAAPVTLDFAKYGVRIYADQDDIYLPVSMLTNIMTDISTRHMLYNGEKLYVGILDLEMRPVEGFYESKVYQAEVQGEARPQDIVQQCYADLCFTIDNFFGHPGTALLDEAIAEKGLDQALLDMGEEGLEVREGLLSSDLTTYLMSVNKLFFQYLCDGHTVCISPTEILDSELTTASSEFAMKMTWSTLSQELCSPIIMQQFMSMRVEPQREQIWGDEKYREYGSTAIIRLDSFMPDEAAWISYYKGEGDLPEDDLGSVFDGLKKASENPEIENVIFDLSCNGGGSSDMLMAILAITTGQDQLYGYNRLTDRRMTLTYEVDANFDGVFDEKDKDARYDFNYGVLVTRHAFSCGNLFPFVLQEAGAVIIGEPSSGGTCCVQIGTDAEGFKFMLSSGQWMLVDSQGNDLEDGCIVDMPIETPSNFAFDALVSLAGVSEGAPSFEAFFDDARLDEMMNEWFQDQAETQLAA